MIWLRRGARALASRLPCVAVGLMVIDILTASVARPAEIQDFSGYNVVVVVWDSLRPDHLGAYGYDRKTSPFIDSLAREGIVFDQASSSSSFTRESVVGLFSGRLPSRSGGMGWAALPEEGRPVLAELFAAGGYRTGFVTTTLVLKNPKMSRGFDSVRNVGDEWNTSRTGMKLTEEALAFVDSEPGKKFMMYLHYLDPHAPYEPDLELLRRFGQKPQATPVKVYGGLRKNLANLREEGFGPGDERFEDLVNRYDAEIVDIDRALEALFDGLEERKVLDRTLFVLTADHGEEFLEHGFLEHAWTLYREATHVPLIMWAKDMQPARYGDPVAHVDLLATLGALTSVSIPIAELDGRSLFVRDAGGLRYRPRGAPVITELLIRHRSILRSVRQGEWKYIAAQRWLAPEERPDAIRGAQNEIRAFDKLPFDPWGSVVREELYHVSQDPWEQENVIADYPDERDELRRVLEAYRTSCVGETEPVADRTGNELSPEDESALRALGYLE